MLAINAVPRPEINQYNLPRNDSDVTGSPFIHPVPPLSEGSWLLGSVMTTGWSFTGAVQVSPDSRAPSQDGPRRRLPFSSEVIPVAFNTTAANIATPAP
jgi:hypothetical protein